MKFSFNGKKISFGSKEFAVIESDDPRVYVVIVGHRLETEGRIQFILVLHDKKIGFATALPGKRSPSPGDGSAVWDIDQLCIRVAVSNWETKEVLLFSNRHRFCNQEEQAGVLKLVCSALSVFCGTVKDPNPGATVKFTEGLRNKIAAGDYMRSIA